MILVTGGTGFVGINIVRRRADEGHDVLCVSRRAADPDPVRDAFLAPVRQRVILAAGDVGRPGDLEPLWRRYRPSHAAHAAAITPTSEMERSSSRSIVAANVTGTVGVLNAAARGGADRIVYVSSAGVYGDTEEDVAITEETPLNPLGLCAITKEASEKLCARYEECTVCRRCACGSGGFTDRWSGR
jgi:nucleoside-diphosphate-sugar epimerase